MILLILILVILILVIILMKMIQILLFLSDFWLVLLNLKNAKNLKKTISEELVPVAWHPNSWRRFCVPEDEKKEIKSIFTE